jgi:hypothetical protein
MYDTHARLRSTLIVGPINTPADVKALRVLAYNISHETGQPATWATDTDHSVTDYDALYVAGDVTALRDVPTLVLVGEALAAGMPVHEPLAADEVTECPCGLVLRHTRPYVEADGEIFCNECAKESGCAWCGEWNDVEDLEIVAVGNTWVTLHAGGARRPPEPSGRTRLAQRLPSRMTRATIAGSSFIGTCPQPGSRTSRALGMICLARTP